jgi:5'-deoxynucleotidase YfbR-like HD superfamily hydrolase
MSLDVRDDARLAGRVLRYHTWPHIRPTTNAEHSWQVARIIMSIAPQPYWMMLLPHAVVHDMGEIGPGDSPYPTKKNNPEFGKLHNELEKRCLDEIGEGWSLETDMGLTDVEVWIFKLAEFLEMWEFGAEEMLLGNQFAKKIAERCILVAEKMLDDSKNLEVETRARAYIAKRRQMWSLS